MAPRKKSKPKPKPFTSTGNPHRETRNGVHPTNSRAVQSPESTAGPITRSRVMRAHSPPPIHSIPSEVLSEIFILASLTDREFFERPYFYDNERRTLILCAVCSSWRFLAFSTPRLWNRISISVSHVKEDQAKRKAADLVQWISRSRSLPLTLHVSGRFSNPSYGAVPDAPIISVINDHAARWQTLYFEHFDPSETSLLFRNNGWHSLRRLRYDYSDPGPCPNENVPWAHLTHLEIQDYTPYRAAAMVFMKCPKLVWLSIFLHPLVIGQSTLPIIILEDLVTFRLHTYCLAGFQSILDRVPSLPSLREFSVNQIAGDIEPLSNFFTRSSCTLDRLEICASVMPGDYLDILAHSSCESLTSLSMRPARLGLSVDEEVLQRLTLHRNDAICSHLSSLTIEYHIPTSLLSAALNMVKSRIESAAGQVPEEPALQCLRLHVIYLKKNMAKLDKVGRRSGMEYSRKRTESGCISVLFRRQGFREPPDFSEAF
ncbi:hypothetical protein F5887DRAFT_1284140 [Amanita rubescens]|nr:hypothetical protein F5887DRAFT_1284140 [Amanita rubescens]